MVEGFKIVQQLFNIDLLKPLKQDTTVFIRFVLEHVFQRESIVFLKICVYQ